MSGSPALDIIQGNQLAAQQQPQSLSSFSQAVIQFRQQQAGQAQNKDQERKNIEAVKRAIIENVQVVAKKYLACSWKRSILQALC